MFVFVNRIIEYYKWIECKYAKKLLKLLFTFFTLITL